MNVFSFTQELSSLIIRYTKKSVPNLSPDDNQPIDVKLTKQQVETVVSNVLTTLFRVDETDISFKTPIIVNVDTSIASDNINQSKIDGDTCRSETIQETLNSLTTFYPDLINDESKATLERFQGQNKLISRSNPAIYLTKLTRSSTFVLKKNENTTTTDWKNTNDVFVKIETTNALLQFANEIRISVINFIKQLEDFKKQVTLKLLNTGKLSKKDTTNFGRTASTKTTVPSKICRSSSNFSKIPTSSRLFTQGSHDISNKRKSVNSTTIYTSRKLNSSMPMTRSMFNLHLSPTNKTLNSFDKPKKNPKYAHVKSTISKLLSSGQKP